jgi:hypothetical protein
MDDIPISRPDKRPNFGRSTPSPPPKPPQKPPKHWAPTSKTRKQTPTCPRNSHANKFKPDTTTNKSGCSTSSLFFNHYLSTVFTVSRRGLIIRAHQKGPPSKLPFLGATQCSTRSQIRSNVVLHLPYGGRRLCKLRASSRNGRISGISGKVLHVQLSFVVVRQRFRAGMKFHSS